MGDNRNIVVVPYNPGWPDKFQREAKKLAAIFGPELIAIHHVGSTAIPGIMAKPIIDIMPIVQHIERVDALNPALIKLGYEPRGENGISGRRYFAKGGDLNRTHHIHAYQADNPEVTRHLDFRDYLIAHPRLAQQYAQLKVELAKQFPHDIFGYMAGKDAFIQEMILRAYTWRAKQQVVSVK